MTTFDNIIGTGPAEYPPNWARQRPQTVKVSPAPDYGDNAPEEKKKPLEDDKSPDENSFSGKLRSFSESTTAHGPPHIIGADFLPVKIFWCFFTVVMFGALGYLLSDVFKLFINNSVQTSIEYKRAANMDFPAVTFCSLNMIRGKKLKLDNVSDISNLPTTKSGTFSKVGKAFLPPEKMDPNYDATDEEWNEDGSGGGNDDNEEAYEDNTRRKRQSYDDNEMDYDEDTAGGNQDYNDYKDDYDGDAGEPEAKAQDINMADQQRLLLMERMASATKEQHMLFGHQICDMLLECVYNGVKCHASDFAEQPWNADFGKCYTFNLGNLKLATARKRTHGFSLWQSLKSGSKLYKSRRPGPKNGLHLSFNVQAEEYMSILGNEVGIKVIVHNQTRQPFPEDEGLVISPGTMTYVGVTRKEINRLGVYSDWGMPRTFSSCVKANEQVDNDRNMYAKGSFVEYSQTACLKTCYQLSVVKDCNCYDSSYPSDTIAGHFKQCKYNTTTANDPTSQWFCLQKVLRAYADNKLECNCPATCTDTVFGVDVSQSAWPAVKARELCMGYAAILINRLNNTDDTCKYKHVNASRTAADGPEMSSNWDVWNTALNLKGATNDFDAATKAMEVEMCGEADDFDPSKLKNRLAKVKVYYQEFNFEQLTESPAKKFLDILSDLGGLFGLCLGFSLFTFFEFTLLAGSMIRIGVLKLMQSGKVSPK